MRVITSRDRDVSDAERDAAIARILDAALPARGRPLDRLRSVARSVTPGMLVFGVEDCVFTASVATLLALVPAAWIVRRPEQVAVALFAVAPLFYALVQGLCTWKDIESGTMGWRGACRVTPRELNALRMLAFGTAAVGVCVPVAAMVWLVSERVASFGWMLSVACASLCVYAALALAIVRWAPAVWRAHARWRRRAGVALPIALPAVLWLALCAALATLPGCAQAVLGVPAVVFAIAAITAASLFVFQVMRDIRTAPFTSLAG